METQINLKLRKDYVIGDITISANNQIDGVILNRQKRTCGCGDYDEFVFSYQGQLVTTSEKDWEQQYFKKVIVTSEK